MRQEKKQEKALPEYALRLADEMKRNNVALRSSGRSQGLAEQSGIPPARIERILDGAEPTEREHKAMCRGLPRMKHFQMLLLEYRKSPGSSKANWKELAEANAPAPEPASAARPVVEPRVEEAASDGWMNSEQQRRRGGLGRGGRGAGSEAARVHGRGPVVAPGAGAEPRTAPPRQPDPAPTPAPTIAAPPTIHIAPAPDSKSDTPTPEMVVQEMPASALKVKYSTRGMYTKVEDLNAEDAKLYLLGNVINRTLKSKHVEFLAKEMLEGRWQLTHQGIAFDSESRLLDGQHRLHAIIYAANIDPKISIRMNVAYNVDPKSFKVIDTANSPRSLSDVWTLAEKSGDAAMLTEDGGASGHKRTVIAALRTLRLMLSGAMPPRWSAGELADTLKAFPEVNAAMKLVTGTKPVLGRSGFLAGVAFVMPVESEELVTDFVKKVSTRVGMDSSHAAFLRCYDNLSERSGKNGIADTNLALAVVTIRALWSRKKERDVAKMFIRDVKDMNLQSDPAYIHYRALRERKGFTVV